MILTESAGRHSIELDEQSYQAILSLAVANTGSLDGLMKLIAVTLAAHPDWDDKDGKQHCIGEGCDWYKGKHQTREKAFIKHQSFVLFDAIKAAGFRKVFDAK